MTEPTVSGEEERRWIEALEWHGKRNGEAPLGAADERAWQHWVADPQNRYVYESCAQLHAATLQIGASRVWLRRWQLQKHRRPTRGWLRWSLVSTVLAIAFAVFVMRLERPRTLGHVLPAQTLKLVHSNAAPGAAMSYRTRIGQTRVIRLADASKITLGAKTELSVLYTADQRTVHLDRGEAWFQVRHHEHWPFVVRAGNGTITDLGTAFVVDRESDKVEVDVTQGTVEVSVHGARAHPQGVRSVAQAVTPIRLRRGERLSYGRSGVSAVRAVDPGAATAWTSGELEFNDEPLQYVVENVSRYTGRPIEVAPAAGRLRMTTLLLSHRIDEWLEDLHAVLPVSVTRTTAGVCIRLIVSHRTRLSNACPHG